MSLPAEIKPLLGLEAKASFYQKTTRQIKLSKYFCSVLAKRKKEIICQMQKTAIILPSHEAAMVGGSHSAFLHFLWERYLPTRSDRTMPKVPLGRKQL